MTNAKIQSERIAIIARMSITALYDAIMNRKSFYMLECTELHELENFAKIFGYRQSRSSKNNGISYLRAFYYYLCK